jgi:hypothetical protein
MKKGFTGVLVLLTLLLSVSVAASPPAEPVPRTDQVTLEQLSLDSAALTTVTQAAVAVEMVTLATLDERHSTFVDANDYLIGERVTNTSSTHAARSSPEARCRAV